MNNIRLGLQTHAVREAFSEDPKSTLKRVAEMGYECVEVTSEVLNGKFSLEYYVEALGESGLECVSSTTSWKAVLPEAIDNTIAFFKGLGMSTVVIGSVDFKALAADPSYAKTALDLMLSAYERLTSEGFSVGYHAHDGDFMNSVGDVPFYEYIMANTPKEFQMIEDTGNIFMGGGDPLSLLKKFPGRSPLAHIKGCSKELGYLTPVWQAELDWDVLIPAFVEEGGSHTFIIEFGARGDYEPFDRAQRSYTWLREQVKKGGYKCK